MFCSCDTRWDQSRLWFLGQDSPHLEHRDRQVSRTFVGHTHNVYSVAATPDGTKAVSGSDDKTVRIWNIATGKCLGTFEGHTNLVLSVAVTPDGAKAISGSVDKTLRIWNIATGKCLGTDEEKATAEMRNHFLCGAFEVSSLVNLII
jgi:WD40 repeat protein